MTDEPKTSTNPSDRDPENETENATRWANFRVFGFVTGLILFTATLVLPAPDGMTPEAWQKSLDTNLRGPIRKPLREGVGGIVHPPFRRSRGNSVC